MIPALPQAWAFILDTPQEKATLAWGAVWEPDLEVPMSSGEGFHPATTPSYLLHVPSHTHPCLGPHAPNSGWPCALHRVCCPCTLTARGLPIVGLCPRIPPKASFSAPETPTADGATSRGLRAGGTPGRRVRGCRPGHLGTFPKAPVHQCFLSWGPAILTCKSCLCRGGKEVREELGGCTPRSWPIPACSPSALCQPGWGPSGGAMELGWGGHSV